MAIPNKVQKRLNSGVVGEIAFHGPTRVRAAILDSEFDEDNVFSSAFTYKSVKDSIVEAGGEGKFAGLMISPKANCVGGIQVEGAFVPNGFQSEFLDMGEIYAKVEGVDADTELDTPVYFVIEDGTLTVTKGTNTLVPNCVVERNTPVDTLCVLRLTN